MISSQWRLGEAGEAGLGGVLSAPDCRSRLASIMRVPGEVVSSRPRSTRPRRGDPGRRSGPSALGRRRGPGWGWAGKARALGARPGGPADVHLPDGRPAWIDGGPRTWFEAERVPDPVVHAESVELGRLRAGLPAVVPATELAPDQLA